MNRTILYNPFDNLGDGDIVISLNHDVTSHGADVKIIAALPETNTLHKVTARLTKGHKREELSVPLNERGKTYACFLLPIDVLEFVRRTSKPQTLVLEIEVDGSLTLKKPIVILDNGDYDKYLNHVCGSDWDDPIFWDEATPDQIRHLLFTPPFGDLLRSVPRNDINRDVLFDMLGVAFTGSFNLGPSPPPFLLTINCLNRPQKPPHTDLIQLFWLLSMMGWIWTDIFFFCSSVTVNYSFDWHTGNLSVELQPQFRVNMHSEWVLFNSLNRQTYELVRKITSATMNHSFDFQNMTFEVRMDWKTTPSPMAARAASAD